MARENNLEGVKNIPSKPFKALVTLFDDIEREAKFDHVFIEMLLYKLGYNRVLYVFRVLVYNTPNCPNLIVRKTHIECI